MLRRKFVACLAGVAAWPLAVHAQQPNKLRRIGVLELIDDPMIRSVILPELAQRGFVDGRNLVVDVRIGKSDEMPKLARELVAANPEVIIAASDWALHAALDASKLIPIVASPMGADPVVAGVAVSWAAPGRQRHRRFLDCYGTRGQAVGSAAKGRSGNTPRCNLIYASGSSRARHGNY
jgi:putative tryptophan/tyrosine transport system substrate-binding protein